MNEKEAIIKLKTCNDKAAFAFLYRSYWAKVYNFTRLYITSAVDVEEIVQEVFIKYYNNEGKIQSEEHLKSNKILPDTYLSRCATLFSTVPVRI